MTREQRRTGLKRCRGCRTAKLRAEFDADARGYLRVHCRKCRERSLQKAYERGITKKVCAMCSVMSPVEEFSISADGQPGSYCPPCQQLRNFQRYYKGNSADVEAAVARDQPIVTHGTDAMYGRGCDCELCVEAHAARCREWRETNRDRYNAWARFYKATNPAAIRKTKLKYSYNMTPADWESLYVFQGGRCASCFKDRDLVVDHDHACCADAGRSCGRCIRGLLCNRCNLVAGVLEGSDVIVVQDYLERWNGRN